MNDRFITIIGCGWVGLTTAAIFANSGFTVYAVDKNKQRVDLLKKGEVPFYEKGIEELVKLAVKNKKLLPTTDYSKAVGNSFAVFSCVDTPDKVDGSHDLKQVYAALNSTIKHIKNGAVYVQKSTVPVGTGATIESSLKDNHLDVGYVSNPEFLRESSAVVDTLWFDRVVFGSNSDEASETVESIYRAVEKNRASIAKIAGISAPKGKKSMEYIKTGRNSAELIKVTANAFLSMKITFANSISLIADRTGADITEVMDAVGADQRIGRAFLQSGRGYGGGCFPKDVSGLISAAKELKLGTGLLNEVVILNNQMPGHYVARGKTAIGGSFKNEPVSVLGLAFKPDTSDTRRSPAINIANQLAFEGANVKAYDPEGMIHAVESKHLIDEVKLTSSIEEAVKGAKIVFVATDWSDFKNYDLSKIASLMHKDHKILVDCMNIYDIKDVESAGLTYVGIGRRTKQRTNKVVSEQTSKSRSN